MANRKCVCFKTAFITLLLEALGPVTLHQDCLHWAGEAGGGAGGMLGPAAGLLLAERLRPRSRAAGLPQPGGGLQQGHRARLM